MQIRKDFSNKGMSREMKATSKIGLVKTNLVDIRVISPMFVTRDPNFYRVRELKSIPNPFFVLSYEGIRNGLGFIRGGRRSSLRDHAIIKTKITLSLGH